VVALVCAALVFVAPLSGVAERWSRDHNEGWNALLATRALQGLPLYFPSSALTRNDYPPLSFELIGLVARGLGVADVLFLGRIVAFLSLVVCSVLVFVVARGFGASPAAASLGAAYLLAEIGANHDGYVAMDDPQWLAHAFQLGGLALLVRARAPAANAAGAALVVLALSIKHTLVALPLAVALSLWDETRRPRPLLLGALAGIGATAWLCARHMPLLLHSLLLPRGYVPFDVLRFGARQALYLAPPALAFWLTRRSAQVGRSSRRFVVAYGSVAFVLGAVLVGGVGVDMNSFFDAKIAAGLAAALSADALSGTVPRLGVLAIVLIATPVTLGEQRERRAHAAREQLPNARTIERLRASPAPALCWDLALCYWAGQPFVFDKFTTRQRQAAGELPLDALARALAEARFSAVQLPDLKVLSPAEQDALRSRYHECDAGKLRGAVFLRND
jgi:hypothetical protein